MGSLKPQIRSIIVDLPDPDGPEIKVILFFFISKFFLKINCYLHSKNLHFQI